MSTAQFNFIQDNWRRQISLDNLTAKKPPSVNDKWDIVMKTDPNHINMSIRPIVISGEDAKNIRKLTSNHAVAPALLTRFFSFFALK